MLQLDKTAYLCIGAVVLGIVSNYRYDHSAPDASFALQGFVDDAGTELAEKGSVANDVVRIFGDTCEAGQETLECLIAGCDTVTDMVKTDCEAIVALYHATDGSKWIQKTDRVQTNKACTWFGVVCNGSKRIVYLRLQSNNLVGTLPETLGNLTELIQLNMSNNSLTGPLPTTLGKLKKAQWFLLNNNTLHGNIPTELGGLSSVKRLWLFNNNLTGPLPKELGNLTNVQELLLSNNALSSTIPGELGKLLGIKKLWLDGNQLTGPLPAFLGSLSQLQDLDLSHNQFCGYLPTSLSITWPNGLPFVYDWSINKLIPKGNTNALQTWITKNNIQFGNQKSEKCPLTQEQQLPQKGIN